MFTKVTTLKQLEDYAEANNWGLKYTAPRGVGSKLQGKDYYFVTPAGAHINVEVDESNNIKRWGDFQNY